MACKSSSRCNSVGMRNQALIYDVNDCWIMIPYFASSRGRTAIAVENLKPPSLATRQQTEPSTTSRPFHARARCRFRERFPSPPDLREPHRTVRTKYIGRRIGTLLNDLE